VTRVPGGEDRGWLGFDRDQTSAGPQGSGAEDASTQRGAQEAPASPWLRHDLEPGQPVDATGADHAASEAPGDGGAAQGQGRASRHDPAWLEPELEVPAAYEPHEDVADPADPADPRHPAHAEYPASGAHDDDRHDTGVPPTLGAGQMDDDDATRPRHPGDADGDDGEGVGGGDREDADGDASPLAVVGAAVKEFAIVVGMALVLSFIVKTWLLQAFYIPSGSMEDTLVLNDRVIVSKLTPGPIDLERGDIVVFADPGSWLEETPAVPHGKVVTAIRETMTFVGLLPDNSENHLIKRVIGLPGDHVVCCDEGGRITINGAAIKEPYLKPGDAASEQDFDITVPRGRVWVMGDHRSNSADSRAHDSPENNGSQGSVDERLIVGRAVALVWPLDHLTWLSNPHAVFAKVPAPSSQGAPVGQQAPAGGSTTTGSGGAEVPANDTDGSTGTTDSGG
jgi:signal peptidase I